MNFEKRPVKFALLMLSVSIITIVIYHLFRQYVYIFYLRITEHNYNINDPFEHKKYLKTAMVTGGARGIGEAYVIKLLENGYRVVILDILNAQNKAVELSKKYGRNNIFGIYCDVTDHHMYINAFNEASKISSDGILDIIILNAGIIDVLFNNSEKIIATNLLAPIYGSELYIKQITENLTIKPKKECLIVVTCSLASFVPIDLNLSPVYEASKTGIGAFIRAVKPIATRFNFRIIGICPTSMVETKMTEQYLKENKIMIQLFLHTEGRGGIMQPNNISPALLYIINNTFLNGDLIAVNSNNGIDARLEPVDECGRYIEYGTWNETQSIIMGYAIDYQLKNLLKTGDNHFTGVNTV